VPVAPFVVVVVAVAVPLAVVAFDERSEAADESSDDTIEEATEALVKRGVSICGEEGSRGLTLRRGFGAGRR
jgi:hypothetical protein